MNIDRWFKYAQAKLNDVVRSTNTELDELEAQREAEVADKPWLSSDAENPSFGDAKARIEWESKRQEELNRQAAQRGKAEAEPVSEDPQRSEDPKRDGSDPVAGADESRTSATQPGSGTSADATFSPPLPSSGDESEIAAARIELERREREAANRLEAIRNELGIDPPQP